MLQTADSFTVFPATRSLSMKSSTFFFSRIILVLAFFRLSSLVVFTRGSRILAMVVRTTTTRAMQVMFVPCGLFEGGENSKEQRAISKEGVMRRTGRFRKLGQSSGAEVTEVDTKNKECTRHLGSR